MGLRQNMAQRMTSKSLFDSTTVKGMVGEVSAAISSGDSHTFDAAAAPSHPRIKPAALTPSLPNTPWL